MAEEKQIPTRREFNLDNVIIPEGKLAIVPFFGMQMLSRYLSNLEKLSNGIPYEELGVARMKEMSANKVVQITNDRQSFKKDKILVVNLNGVIQKQNDICSDGTAAKGQHMLDMKDEVIGALLKIDSGGGYMDGAESFISDMKEFGKPIVALSSYAGSAAYMIASQADQIFATSDLAEFGSIGVYIELNKKIKEQYRAVVETAYSQNSPNKNQAFRNWIENDGQEGLKGFIEQATIADDMFMSLVKKARNIEKVNEDVLTGSMFYAQDSKKKGLIDGFGDNSKAYAVIQRLARIKN